MQAWNRKLCFTTVVVDHNIGLFKTWNFPLLDTHALSFTLKVNAPLLYNKIETTREKLTFARNIETKERCRERERKIDQRTFLNGNKIYKN